MKPGQVLTGWWQKYGLGRLTTPQAIYQTARHENPDPARASLRFFDDAIDGPTWDVPQRLQAPSYFTGPAYLTHGEKADWQMVDRRLMLWAARVCEMGRRRGIPLYVHSAFRTKAEQEALLQRGVTKAPWPRSAHCIGEAVDIVHGVYHWQLTPQEWQFLAVLGRLALDRLNATLPKRDKLALNWGGDDGPRDTFRWDPAHWEIQDYRIRLRQIEPGPREPMMPRGILSKVRL